MRRHRELIGVGLLLFGALVVRLVVYRTILPPDINNDEFSWAWAGQGIFMHHGVPGAWSYLSGYGLGGGVMANPVTHSWLPWQPRWVDHPPLFAAFVGLFERLAGQTSPDQASIAVIRLAPVLCSTACVGLLYALVRRHFGRLAAVVAAALLAFTPVALSASVLTEAEFAVAAVLLAALLLIDTRRRAGLVALLALCALAPLVKETGIIVAGSVIVILLIQRRWRLATAVAGAGILGVGLLMAWGAFVDWNLFLGIAHDQATRHFSRPTNPLAFPMSLAAGYGNYVPFRDPLWYAGLVATVVAGVTSIVRRRWTGAIFVVPIVLTTLLMVVMAPGPAVYFNGWYRLAIYPLVYAAAAWLVVTMARAAGRFIVAAIRDSDWTSEVPFLPSGHRPA